MKKRKKLPPHWYFITYQTCPVCGREKQYRERRYDKRPDNWNDRHDFEEIYDWCDAL